MKIYSSAYPNILFTPLRLGSMLIFHGSKSSFAFFPSTIIKVHILPPFSRLYHCIFRYPVFLLRIGNHRIQFEFFRSHETVSLSVYFSYANQRKALAGPMFHCTIIQVILKSPCTRIRVNSNQRIGRRTQFILHMLLGLG
ncbi:unknown [Bacteroides intestinalis CAG:564]|nr:unknown [Bacteroides intestinalis CAG:564]